MPAYRSAAPIRIRLDLSSGSAHLRAVEADGPDADAVLVEVRPADPAKKGDVQAAERTEVAFVDGELRVTNSGTWRTAAIFGGGSENVAVEITAPAGSTVQGSTKWGSFETEGRFGRVDFRSSGGDVRVEEAEDLSLHASAGQITVGRAAGRIALSSGSGSIRAQELRGEVTVKNANGSTSIGRVDGALKVNGAHASVEIGRAHGDVTVTTASGGVDVERADGGTLRLETSYGGIAVGVPEGTPVWLDVAAERGQVRSTLESADAPAPDDDAEPLELHARSAWGNIRIHRPTA